MYRKWIYLYFALCYFFIPHKDVIKTYSHYGFTVNETQKTIYHHDTGRLLTYQSSKAQLTIYFPDYDQEPNHFVSYLRSFSGQRVITVGRDFDPPPAVNTNDMATVFLTPDTSMPSFTEMCQRPYFHFILWGWGLYVFAPFVWYRLTWDDFDEHYDEEQDGTPIRRCGLLLVGIGVVLALFQRLSLGIF